MHAAGGEYLNHASRRDLGYAGMRVAVAGPLIMASLVTGLVVVEYILYFPGVGRLQKR